MSGLLGRRRCQCWHQTKIWAQTVHLMDGFWHWTKIIILRWTSRRIFDDGPLKIWKVGQVDRWTEIRPWRPGVDYGAKSWSVRTEKNQLTDRGGSQSPRTSRSVDLRVQDYNQLLACHMDQIIWRFWFGQEPCCWLHWQSAADYQLIYQWSGDIHGWLVFRAIT